LRLAHAAKERNVPIVLTYHTPTVTCQRGTLMRWGKNVCDGVLRRTTCTACTLHGHGIPRPLALGAGSLPPALGGLLEKSHLSGGLWTALRMSDLVALRHAATRSLLAIVDRVVAQCRWAKQMLIANGVEEYKIIGSPQGIEVPSEPARRPKREPDGSLKVAFFGRLAPEKGPEILLEALRLLPELRLSLDVFGVVQGGDDAYADKVRSLIAEDRRVGLQEPLPREVVIEHLAWFDVLAVPSQWLETGPLVVLEAFAAGVPVIGSSLGGIRELVRDEVNGLLVAPDSVHAWAQALLRLATEDGLIERLASGVCPPRHIDDVADDMASLYANLALRPRKNNLAR